MSNSTILFNGPLATGFQSSQAFLILADHVVLDFDLVIGERAPVVVQWFPEFAEGDLPIANARWYRETAEEDIGNGDVRMPYTIRRFTANGADAGLAPGTYRLSVQLKRTHQFCRIQIAGAGCTATVRTPFGEIAA